MTPLIYETTKYNDSTFGLFNYILKHEKYPIKLSSSMKINNLESVIDIEDEVTAMTEIFSSNSLPLTFDINLGPYSVLISNYMIQAGYENRMMREWKILGSNDPNSNSNWIEIDHQDNYPYCEAGGSKDDTCFSNPYSYIDSQMTQSFRVIRFEFLKDQAQLDDDVRFRLRNFEIYGSLHKLIQKYSKITLYDISSLFIFNTIILT